MAGYQYNGAVHDATPQPKPKRRRKMTQFEPDACGTYAGYRRHGKWGVPPCKDCKAAMAAYSRDRYQPRTRKGFSPDACGTLSGLYRHEWWGVPVCDACKVAKNAYQRARRAARKQMAA